MYVILGDQLQFKYDYQQKRNIPDVEWDSNLNSWRSKKTPFYKNYRSLTNNNESIRRCVREIEEMGGVENREKSIGDIVSIDVPEDTIINVESLLNNYGLIYDIK